MKKMYYTAGAETCRIFTDLPECFGINYFVETCGEPVEDDGSIFPIEIDGKEYSYDEYAEYLVETEGIGVWEDCNDNDLYYVLGWAKIWGILWDSEACLKEYARLDKLMEAGEL